MNYWKQMSSGRYVDLAAVRPGDVRLDDITTSLSRITRFSGHTMHGIEPLTVAQHSLMVHDIAKDLTDDPVAVLAAVSHDFEEAYTGDIITPVKRMLKDTSFIRDIESSIQKQLMPDFDIDAHYKVVRYADLISLHLEREVLFGLNEEHDHKWPVRPFKTGNYNAVEMYHKYRSKTAGHLKREFMNAYTSARISQGITPEAVRYAGSDSGSPVLFAVVSSS